MRVVSLLVSLKVSRVPLAHRVIDRTSKSSCCRRGTGGPSSPFERTRDTKRTLCPAPSSPREKATTNSNKGSDTKKINMSHPLVNGVDYSLEKLAQMGRKPEDVNPLPALLHESVLTTVGR